MEPTPEPTPTPEPSTPALTEPTTAETLAHLSQVADNAFVVLLVVGCLLVLGVYVLVVRAIW